MLQILYKVISSIVNSRLLGAVKFDDLLHGNRPNWGTRHWKQTYNPVEYEELVLFYADDGMITGTDQARVQASLDTIMSSFATVGLLEDECTQDKVYGYGWGRRHTLHI